MEKTYRCEIPAASNKSDQQADRHNYPAGRKQSQAPPSYWQRSFHQDVVSRLIRRAWQLAAQAATQAQRCLHQV
jgi:hypothetical protein